VENIMQRKQGERWREIEMIYWEKEKYVLRQEKDADKI
jgi:hypothetical protein